MKQQEFRNNILTAYGANEAETEELLAYNQNAFAGKSRTLVEQVSTLKNLTTLTLEELASESVSSRLKVAHFQWELFPNSQIQFLESGFNLLKLQSAF